MLCYLFFIDLGFQFECSFCILNCYRSHFENLISQDFQGSVDGASVQDIEVRLVSSADASVSLQLDYYFQSWQQLSWSSWMLVAYFGDKHMIFFFSIKCMSCKISSLQYLSSLGYPL